MVSLVVKGKTVTLRAGKHVKQKGYSLVVVMVAIVIMSILAEAAISLDSYRIKKSKEAELLFIGLAYKKALQSYAGASTAQQSRSPQRLEDLISDPRFTYRRHLRRLYPDPMRSNNRDASEEVIKQWRVLRNSKGGIVGVASKNKDIPLKKAFFPPPLSHFANAKQYSEWVFGID